MRKLILIIDDEEVIATTLEFIFNRKSGDEFLAVRATNLAKAFVITSAITPDLVLLDVCMPGARGLDAAIEFRDELGLKVLLITGWPGVTQLLLDLESQGIPPFPVLPKPSQPEEMLKKIRELLGTEPLAASAGAEQQ